LGTHPAVYLQLWSQAAMKSPIIRRIDLKVHGHSFRYSVEGAGLMQLYLDGVKDGIIHHTHFGCWSEAGAKQRSIHPTADCDWRALAKVSGQIQRHVRQKLAVAKLHGRPVLRHAFDSVSHGSRFLFHQSVFGSDELK
jgi:hypothetical protein